MRPKELEVMFGTCRLAITKIDHSIEARGWVVQDIINCRYKYRKQKERRNIVVENETTIIATN